MAGTIIAVVILVLVLGGAAWFLFIRQPKSKGSARGSAAPPPQTSDVSATESGDSNLVANEEGTGEIEEDDLLPEDEGDDESDDNRSLKELVTEAEGLHREGSYDSAIDTFEAALEKAREQFGRGSVEVAAILLAQGASYQARDDDEDDDETFPPCYPRALAILEYNWGPFDERLLPVLRHLISFYDQTGRHGEADTLRRRYESILRRKQEAARQAQEALTQNSPIVGNASDGAATGSPATGNATTGGSPNGDTTSGATSSAPTIAPKYFGVINFASVDSESCREADKHLANFEYDDAIDSYWSVLDKVRSERGRDAIELVEILSKLARAIQDRDDEDDENRDYDPDDFLLRALAIAEQHKGPLDPSLAPIFVALISCYDEEGRHSDADSLIWRLEALSA